MAKSETREPGLLHQACEVFTGPHGGFAWLGLLVGLAFAILLVYALWRFCQAPDADLATQLHWALIAILSALAVALIKLWFWLMMIRNSIVRELNK